jgi:hypothetical protein
MTGLPGGIGRVQTPPCLGSACQRMHARDSEILQTQRRTGARCFVRSSTKHDNIAIARDLFVAHPQFFESEPPRAGDGFGLIEHAA